MGTLDRAGDDVAHGSRSPAGSVCRRRSPGPRPRPRAARWRRPPRRRVARPSSAASSSRASGSWEPTATTTASSRSRAESKTGDRAEVAQTTTSADRSACVRLRRTERDGVERCAGGVADQVCGVARADGRRPAWRRGRWPAGRLRSPPPAARRSGSRSRPRRRRPRGCAGWSARCRRAPRAAPGSPGRTAGRRPGCGAAPVPGCSGATVTTLTPAAAGVSDGMSRNWPLARSTGTRGGSAAGSSPPRRASVMARTAAAGPSAATAAASRNLTAARTRGPAGRAGRSRTRARRCGRPCR